jgi:hypothetical protein
MRILIFSLCLLLVSTHVFGQRKSKVDPKDAQIDSLMKTNKSLTLQLDSVSKELVKYVGVYDAIKEKVLHYKFDPTRSSYLIDSLKASRDSTSALLSVVPKSTRASDSLYLVLKESTLLKARIDSIMVPWGKEKSALTAEEIEKARAVGNLKQLKELLDSKIISDAEYVTLKKKYLEKL